MARGFQRALIVCMALLILILTLILAPGLLAANEPGRAVSEPVHPATAAVQEAAPAGHPANPIHVQSPLVEHLEHAVKLITILLARLVEMFAGIIIGVASLKAIWKYFRGFLAGENANPAPEVRIGLGRALALALELELGADILGTAVAPTWNDIGQLAAIAVLRTALNYFLEREMHSEAAHHAAHAATHQEPRKAEPDHAS